MGMIKVVHPPAPPAPPIQVVMPQPKVLEKEKGDGQLVNVFAGQLQNLLPKCPNSCSGHGTCLASGKCKCNEPYTASEDCAKAPTSVDECSVCCVYQCTRKCNH